ncbi:hypothetical protein Ancab_020368 [Ancistrocladus abbreviatus]
MASRERHLEADLECGGTASEEEGGQDSISGCGQRKKTLNRVCSGILSFNGSIKGELDRNLGDDSLALSRDNSSESIELLVEKNLSGESVGIVPLLEKSNPKEKRKKPNSKRPPKPPRPPKGPSLSASDLKLVREISELAAKKRARIERMRAQRKMRASKGSSSSSNIIAMVITIIFFVVIIIQGLRSRGSFRVGFQGSPVPAVATEGLISMKFYNSPSNEINGPISHSPSAAVEEASGSIPLAVEHVGDEFGVISS